MGKFQKAIEEFQVKIADLWIDIAFEGKEMLIDDPVDLAKKLDEVTLIAIKICFKHGSEEAEKFLRSDAKEFSRNHLKGKYND